MIFERIREVNFKLHLGTCTFAACDVAYLGHIVNACSVIPDMNKVAAVK
jgi:hypothetical protein